MDEPIIESVIGNENRRAQPIDARLHADNYTRPCDLAHAIHIATCSAIRLASVNPVSTGLTEPTVGNKD